MIFWGGPLHNLRSAIAAYKAKARTNQQRSQNNQRCANTLPVVRIRHKSLCFFTLGIVPVDSYWVRIAAIRVLP